MIPFVVIGHPDNRRVRGFVDAVVAANGPGPDVFAHRDLLDDLRPLEALDRGPRWVRIDAIGESPATAKRLLQLGYRGGPPDELARPITRRSFFFAEAGISSQRSRVGGLSGFAAGFTKYLSPS